MKTVSFILLLNLAIVSFVKGGDYRSGKAVRVNATDSLSTDLLAGARYVDILGYIDGDIYSGGQKINIEGEVTDNVMVCGQELAIRGKVGGMVMGCFESILIDGEVAGDVIVFGGEVRITERAHIKGSLFVGTSAFYFEGGQIDGEIGGGAADVYLNGSVGKSVELEAGKVDFGPDYHAALGTELQLEKEMKGGNIPEDLEITLKKKSAFYQSKFFYWSFIAMLIVGFLITKFFKTFISELVNFASEDLLKNAGFGLLFLLIVPLVTIVLLILILTIPIALILLGLYIILIYISSIFTGIFIGDHILSLTGKEKLRGNLFLPLLIGLVLIVFLQNLPFIGWLIRFAAVCLGSGSFVLYLWHLVKTRPKAV